MASFVGQIFLGVRLECAKCHHHPSERWDQSDYYQLAAYFTRVKHKGEGISAPISGEPEYWWFGPGAATINHPVTNAALGPRPPGDKERPIADGEDPRASLLDWMTSPENPYFARAVVNRLWSAFNSKTNPRVFPDSSPEADFSQTPQDLPDCHVLSFTFKARLACFGSLPPGMYFFPAARLWDGRWADTRVNHADAPEGEPTGRASRTSAPSIVPRRRRPLANQRSILPSYTISTLDLRHSSRQRINPRAKSCGRAATHASVCSIVKKPPVRISSGA